jgi:SAM-dependent methyltransferase
MNSVFESFHSDYTAKLRRRRFAFFERLLDQIEKPIRVLDCGGTVDFWRVAGMAPFVEPQFEVTIVNLFETKDVPANFAWHVGDVRDLTRFRDHEFDVVFSNAVINLMPTWEDQIRMSREIMRVGKRYFVQSPNRYFPIDWRTLVPFFHFLRPEFQAWCFRHFRVGTYPRVKAPTDAYELATRVRDLSVTQIKELFPGCGLFREHWFGFTKSIAAYGGWS